MRAPAVLAIFGLVLTTTAACSSSSAMTATGDTAFRCADTGDDCVCDDPPQQSEDAKSCGSYSCCAVTTTTSIDGVTRHECECSNDVPCIPVSGATRVASCP